MEELLNTVSNKLMSYWMLIALVVAAFMMALFRTTKVTGKPDWIEASMCTIFAFGIWFCFGLLSIPEELGVITGTFIGYKGTHWVSEMISDKFDLDKDDK